MEYMDYQNINELCDDLQFELKHIHDYSEYIVNGQSCALTFGTMNKMKLFISWMSTRKKKTHFNFLLNTFFPLHIRISISSGKKT